MQTLNITKTENEMLAILRSLSEETLNAIEDADFEYSVLGQSKRKVNALLKKVGLTYDEWDYLGC